MEINGNANALHVREQFLSIPIDLVVDGLSEHGGLLDHGAVRLNAASRTTSASAEFFNVVDGFLRLNWSSNRSREDGSKTESFEESHRE
jgi:hypothetical protein